MDAQAAFLREQQSGSARCGPNDAKESKDDWEFGENVSVSEVSVPGLHAKLREVQRVCEEVGLAVRGTVVKIAMLTKDAVEERREEYGIG